MTRATAVFGKVAIANHIASSHTISGESTTILNRIVTVFEKLAVCSKHPRSGSYSTPQNTQPRQVGSLQFDMLRDTERLSLRWSRQLYPRR
jgi:hypothetical protein